MKLLNDFDEFLNSQEYNLTQKAIKKAIQKLDKQKPFESLSEVFQRLFLKSCEYYLKQDTQKALEYSLKIDLSLISKKSTTYTSVALARASCYGTLRMYQEEVNIYKKLLKKKTKAYRLSILSNIIVSFMREGNYVEAKKYSPEIKTLLLNNKLEINPNDRAYILSNWLDLSKSDYLLSEILNMFEYVEKLEINELSSMILVQKKAEIYNHFNQAQKAIALVENYLKEKKITNNKLYLHKVMCKSAIIIKKPKLFEKHYKTLLQNKFTFDLYKSIQFYTEIIEYLIKTKQFNMLEESFALLKEINEEYTNSNKKADFMKAKMQLQNKENELKAQKLDKVQELNKKLEIANESLERFGAILAHDIKSPLKTLNALTDLLLSGNLKMEEKISIKAETKINIQNLLNIVDNLLLFSKNGKFSSQNTNFDSQEAIQHVLKNNKFLIEERKAKINTQGNIPFKMNQSAFILILQNLILNAIKFSYKNRTPIIDIKLYETKKKKYIEIQDNGIGINPIDLDNIFKDYYRSEEIKTIQGLGLGLNTVKRIVHFYKGEIVVDSKVDKGTTIQLIFDAQII